MRSDAPEVRLRTHPLAMGVKEIIKEMPTTREYREYHGTCIVCLKVRKCTPQGVMVPHRMWVPSEEIGYMTPCEGSGKPPVLEPKEDNDNSNDQ